MTLAFNDRLRQVSRSRNSLLCVGLDPDPEKLPAHLNGDILRFNLAIVQATAPYAAAFKLNAAFYEALGEYGLQALRATIEAIPSDVITIYDAKRGDIGNSSRFYARAAFDLLGCDAVTVNPYMGRDAVEPFLKDPAFGAFVLCLTSNPSANDFQTATIDGLPLFKRVALAVQDWNTADNCGLVVGATHPEPVAELRSLVPELPFLVPGIGAQGGQVATAVRAATDTEGLGALFNVSRGILYASNGNDFAEAAARKAEQLRDEINQHRRRL